MDEPLVMGIINATPDSFYEGHLNAGMEEIVSLAGNMLAAGAAILDVGGLSTRPGSRPVSIEEETLWLNQKQLGELFNVEIHTINYHIKKIFTDNELEENSVIRNFRITANDGKTYNTKH